MDETFLKLAALYDEMYGELDAEMKALNGKVNEFSYEEMAIYVTVAPELQEYAENWINELIVKYNKKRRVIMRQDVFIGVKTILLEQHGVD